VLFSLGTPETVLVSDELTQLHRYNGMKARPAQGAEGYGHLDLRDLEQRLEESLDRRRAHW